MCIISGCVKLWRDNVALQDLTCPCGHTYWDNFQERFIRNIAHRTFDRDGRALSMEPQEARLKRKMASEKFEASIRAQFIIHCLGCGIRRRMDDGEAGAGFDDAGLLRALAELQEVANGDYTSRGSSTTFQEVSTVLPVRQQRQPGLSSPAANTRRPARDTPVSEPDYQALSSTSRPRQEAPLSRVSSTEQGSRTSTDSQRGTRRAPSSSITSVSEVDPADDDQSPRRIRSSEEPRTETQPRYRSSRDEPRRPITREEDTAGSDSAPRPTLSALLTKFVSFSESQYDSIATFCEHHPEIWDEDTGDLQRSTRYYLRRGDTERAQCQAQRLLMLTLSRRGSKSREDQQRWLSRLSRNTRLQEELDENVETLLAKLG